MADKRTVKEYFFQKIPKKCAIGIFTFSHIKFTSGRLVLKKRNTLPFIKKSSLQPINQENEIEKCVKIDMYLIDTSEHKTYRISTGGNNKYINSSQTVYHHQHFTLTEQNTN